eukprot:360663-Chlamydomonas_euryale.AAC.1
MGFQRVVGTLQHEALWTAARRGAVQCGERSQVASLLRAHTPRARAAIVIRKSSSCSVDVEAATHKHPRPAASAAASASVLAAAADAAAAAVRTRGGGMSAPPDVARQLFEGLSHEQLVASLEDAHASLASAFARMEAYRLQGKALRAELSALRSALHSGGGGGGGDDDGANGSTRESLATVDAAMAASEDLNAKLGSVLAAMALPSPSAAREPRAFDGADGGPVYVSEIQSQHPVSVLVGNKKVRAAVEGEADTHACVLACMAGHRQRGTARHAGIQGLERWACMHACGHPRVGAVGMHACGHPRVGAVGMHACGHPWVGAGDMHACGHPWVEAGGMHAYMHALLHSCLVACTRG